MCLCELSCRIAASCIDNRGVGAHVAIVDGQCGHTESLHRLTTGVGVGGGVECSGMQASTAIEEGWQRCTDTQCADTR